MGKKGRWFSALRRAFTSTSKDKSVSEQLQKNDVTSLERKYVKEKKRWGIGRSRDAEPNSFIPLHREPSSIEQILGDAEREQQHWIHQAPPKRSMPQKKVLIPPNVEVIPKHESLVKQEKTPKKELLSKNGQSTDYRNPLQNREFLQIKETLLPKRDFNSKKEELAQKEEAVPKTVKRRPPVTLIDAQISATKIQAAYRGYKARKSYGSLKGLIRLQELMRGESVKHQTMNAMRCMQLLVRVQSQIRSRRMQRIENRNHPHNQAFSKTKMENENNFGRWYLATQSEAEDHEHWVDSMLTKDEVDKRMQRKVEAIMKRERALAYAYSHQLLKVTPKTASAMLTDIRSGGYPMWWSWLERTVGPKDTTTTASVPATSSKPTTTISSNTFRHTKNHPFDSSTPRPSLSKPAFHPRISSNRWSAQPPARDDESLTSCPPFTAVPGYMAPTVSARAKVREATPPASADVRRRFSAALGQSLGSLRWTGSRPKESDKRAKHRPTGSIGTLSVDSTFSLPVGLTGRRPFK